MDANDILEIVDQIRQGAIADDCESEFLEIKPFPLGQSTGFPRPDKRRLAGLLREYSVCYANSKGGMLLFGIKDNVHGSDAIQGCAGYDIDEMKRMVFDGTDPPLTVDILEITVDEGVLLVCKIPKSPRIHATYSGRRFRRVGKDCKPISPTEDILIEVEKGGDYTVKFIRDVGLEALDTLEVQRLRNWITRYQPGAELLALDDQALLKAMGLLQLQDNQLRPTVACLLLVGKEEALRNRLPQHEILFFRSEMVETEPAQSLSFRKPLLATIDRIWEIIQPFNSVQIIKDGLFEIPIPSFPEEVVREGLFNAVIHRSYVDTEAISVRLYKDRLEIGSPGGFIGGITPENILTHEPNLRGQSKSSL